MSKTGDPGNADGIGKKELLAVSFGTSYADTRARDIYGIEKALEDAYPGWSVRRAFTSGMIIRHIQKDEGIKIDNVEDALKRAVANGVEYLVLQPTHLVNGHEYDKIKNTIDEYSVHFKAVAIATPLLGEASEDPKEINADKEAVAKAVVSRMLSLDGYNDLKEAKDDKAAYVLMGHGTYHEAKISYTQMQAQIEALGFDNVFIGTVEGDPDGTDCEDSIKAVAKAGYRKIVLRPLMVVAGDHANNDMADKEDPDSWISRFISSGCFEEVKAQVEGLGCLEDIQSIYVQHAKAAIDSIDI